MFPSDSLQQIKHRSVSQQNSKRSSVNILNINDSSMLNLHQRQTPNHNLSKANEESTFVLEQHLSSLKNKLIEGYRVVRIHAKAKNYVFSEAQLQIVYQGMSNALKTLQKTVQTTNKIKNELAKRQQFNASSKMLKSFEEQNEPSLKHCNSYLNSFISLSNDQPNLSQYVTRIQELETEIEQQRQKNSQQIRIMIQNHEEEMMFFQQEQNLKISKIKKEHQQQIESLLQAHKKREEEIRVQTSRKVNEQIKTKIQTLRQQESAKVQQLTQQFQQKQTKYKSIVKSLVQKLTESRSVCQILNRQLQENFLKTKMIFQKLTKNQCTGSQPKNEQYLKLLYEKLNSLAFQDLSNKFCEDSKNAHKNLSIPYANPQPGQASYCTMAIEQMFMKSDDSMMDMQNHHFEHSLQSILEQLIWWNFFCEENQENVLNLFGLGRNRGNDENSGPSGILSHTLYPLILEKIKLTLGKLQSQNHLNLGFKDSSADFAISQNPNQITEFSTENIAKLPNNMFPIRYRNIQSIDELEVSDSMICDENRQDKEKRIMGSENFQNHSPIINYKGYETPDYCDQSASFDVDLF